MTQLTPHFTLEELTVTSEPYDNTPDASQVALLTTLAEFLEKIRTGLGNVPITINSAFRSAQVNAAVGGVSDSAHAICYAADFTADDAGTVYEVAQKVAKLRDEGHICFDQLIYEGTWVHVSRDPQLRGQLLTHVAGDDYIPGLIGP